MAPPPVAGVRDTALDFVKGFLVLVMVVYHWLNYYVGFEWDGYRYLRFLTPSFILITGVVVSHVYLAKYSYDSPVLRQRLVQRGLKLLLLFAALNLGETMLETRSYQPGTLLATWPGSRLEAVFVSGGEAAFSILVPIAYFLIAAPAVLVAAKRLNIGLGVIAAFAVAIAITASILGGANSHLELLAIALIGLAAGQHIERLAHAPLLLIGIYAAYLATITAYNVLFTLQVVGVCASVLLLYAVGKLASSQGFVGRLVIELGKYSLFAYVVQIAVLQVIRRVIHAEDVSGPAIMLPLALATTATIAAVLVATGLRSRSVVADRVYRTVFA